MVDSLVFCLPKSIFCRFVVSFTSFCCQMVRIYFFLLDCEYKSFNMWRKSWYPLPPWKWKIHFSVPVGGLHFHMDNGGSLHIGESQLGIFLWGLQYQFLAQLANAGPKSVKVNLTNCHREVCRITFYQIVNSDVLTSLWLFDKMLFW